MPHDDSEDDDPICPHCGSRLTASAQFCRHCGASEDSGWNEEDNAESWDGGYIDEGDFDYDDFVRREFPGAANTADVVSTRKTLAWIIVVLTCLSFFLWAIASP